uniref:Endoplasmic reticulum lectin 1 n=1 Tax=Pristhesancus plagipennis TaxID=1955184 RepID=A0A2K8JM33_PRIPG|nr:secreted Glucosidase beta-subunit-like protein [Pristhesancus plagipennis]
MFLIKFCIVTLFIAKIICAIAFESFDDSILYKINWPGNKGYDTLLDSIADSESLYVVSHEKEKYRCIIPQLKEKEKTNEEEYIGPNPIELLAPIFHQSSCTSLLESYWTYELCHGKYIRQYHEEREGTKIKLQEYYLGKWDVSKTLALSAKFEKQRDGGKPLVPPKKKLDGISLPYLQLNFTDGTICDLNDRPRRTSVLYVCFAGGKNDIFVIKETSTCEYEVIVISSELCKHPKYRPQVSIENEINCLPVDDAPKKPLGLVKMEADGFKQRHLSTFGDSKSEHMFAVYSIDEYKDKDGRMQVRVELRPLDNEDDNELPSALEDDESPATTAHGSSDQEELIHSAGQMNPVPQVRPVSYTNKPSGDRPQAASTTAVDSQQPDIPLEVSDFLQGKACLHGGQDWWKYKFCYGGSVEQYHIEKGRDGIVKKTSILLGVFDKEAHIAWIKKHPSKMPRPIGSRTFLFQYYNNGDICKETGKPRETQVKLKCIEKKGTVSMYLLEPQMCQYILGVDSPLVCDFINNVDEYGLIEPK